ncbi:MAG TPA: outer membrane beta-barrel protein, partial [Chryseosolibacter sp.]|nr:outer membrane beta-barrel protein [Chryseosolibacter sp.]
MKKIFAFLLVGMVAATSVYSQVTFMPKAGATLSNVAYSDDIKDSWGADFGSKVGFVIGIAAEIPLGAEMWSLQPELLWNQKGFSYKYEEAGYKEDYNYTFNYLEVPLLVKVKIGAFHALAGPSIGYGIIGGYKGTYSENGSEIDDSG